VEPAAYVAIAEKRLHGFTSQRTLIPVNAKASEVCGIVENAFEKTIKTRSKTGFHIPLALSIRR
jgi:hypothetical protein